MDKHLSYQDHDEKTIIVYGDRKKYQKQVNLLGGRWNSKKNGWLVPISNKNKIDNLISLKIPDDSSSKIYLDGHDV